MSDIRFNFVQQPTPNTCVLACISMVTGASVAGLVERFGDKGQPIEVEIAVLVEHGIFPDLRYSAGTAMPKGFYFASAPSLNIPGGLHRVVVELNDDYDFIIHDPNAGREGVKWYPQNAIHGGEPGICMVEVLRLDTDMLKHMKNAGAMLSERDRSDGGV